MKNILFITSNRIGDAILSTGILQHLVETETEARFTIVCSPLTQSLWQHVPRLHKIILLKKQRYNKHWIAAWRACLPQWWDMIVDMRNSVISRFLFSLHIRRSRPNRGQHKARENADVLRLCHIPPLHLWFDKNHHNKAEQLLSGLNDFLALGPTANWPAKQWPIECFAALALNLTGAEGLLADKKIVIFAAAHENDQIITLRSTLPKAHFIVGEDLMVVAACLKRAKIFVGNDSGLTHLAAATGIKTLALFGPGYEAIYGPAGSNSHVVRTKESREALLASYAKDPTQNLMNSLSVSAVTEKIRSILS
jgi:heptosyltransferase III